jgi:hypothetical protein
MFDTACKKGTVSKLPSAPYKSGPCKSSNKVRNPKPSVYLRISGGWF